MAYVDELLQIYSPSERRSATYVDMLISKYPPSSERVRSTRRGHSTHSRAPISKAAEEIERIEMEFVSLRRRTKALYRGVWAIDRCRNETEKYMCDIINMVSKMRRKVQDLLKKQDDIADRFMIRSSMTEEEERELDRAVFLENAKQQAAEFEADEIAREAESLAAAVKEEYAKIEAKETGRVLEEEELGSILEEDLRLAEEELLLAEEEARLIEEERRIGEEEERIALEEETITEEERRIAEELLAMLRAEEAEAAE